jgi:hypothetical protein
MKRLLRIHPPHIYNFNFKYAGGECGITPFKEKAQPPDIPRPWNPDEEVLK